jgi:hypothetical protein
MTTRESRDDDSHHHHYSHSHHDSKDKFRRERHHKESGGRGRSDRHRDRSRSRSRSPERYKRRRSRSRSMEANNRRSYHRGTYDTSKKPSMEYLMSFKQFLEILPLHIEEEEAVKKYVQYKETFQLKYVKTFFEQHKDEEWLKEEYHPAYIKGKKERMQQLVQEHYSIFLKNYNKGVYDHINLDQVAYEDTMKGVAVRRQSKRTCI